MKFLLRCTAVLLTLAAFARAQTSAVPAVVTSIPAQTLLTGATANLDLRTYFTISGITGQVAQFDTVRGKFNVALLAADAPRTVTNFLNYINRSAYSNSLIHRSVPGFIIQGGGFTLSGTSILNVATDAAVPNEFKLSNVRGTLAMAKLGNDPNSATSQWFVNLADNGPGTLGLDTQNGGFAVFARVLGTGMSVADSIAALTVVDATATLGSTFNQLPLVATPLSAANLVLVRSIKVVPLFPAGNGDAAAATFVATSTNSTVASATLAGSTLALTAIGSGSATITVRATDVNGNFAESTFVTTVTQSPPVITGQPVSVVASAGQTVALTVSAAGAGLTYQWQRAAGAIVLLAATNPTLLLNNVSAADADTYFCRVTNSAGTVTSANATVTVGAAGQPTRLSNLSVRTNLGTDQLLIVGFSTTGAKNLLVRGIGPKLADFGIPNFYADPRLEIYDGASVKKTENDNWDSALAPTFASLGAFALNSGSKDAALITSVTGGYTAQLKGTGNGVALLEVYDAVASFSPRLSNVSARNFVGTGGNVLIAGFTVDGPVAKTLLIRGIGPKLAVFAVLGALADPKLELYSGATKLAENDNWSAGLAPTFASVGAFALDNASKDAALLITLPPGGYTAQISGADGGTGEALVEIYEVP